MEFKSEQEIKEANLSEWERKVILKEFRWRKNLSEVANKVSGDL